MKNTMVPHTTSYCLETEVSIALLCQLYSTHYTVVRIKNWLKSTSVIKVAAMKIRTISLYTKEAITCNHSINAFHCQQRWMEHKGDTGKSLKNALHVRRYVKRHLSSWSDIEQWKNQAGSLSHYRVTLVWRHQAVS